MLLLWTQMWSFSRSNGIFFLAVLFINSIKNAGEFDVFFNLIWMEV